MGNINLNNFVFNKNTELHAGQIADIFDIDGDFLENQEYFREDTISIGYLTESQRCAVEVFEKHKGIKDPKEQLETILNSVINHSFETEDGTVTQFILESSHCSSYETEILEYGDYLFLSIAYTS